MTPIDSGQSVFKKSHQFQVQANAMLGDDELDRDVLDDFLSYQGAELLMTLGRHLFSRHQDVAQLSKVRSFEVHVFLGTMMCTCRI